MANLHINFIKLSKAISITPGKRVLLSAARQAIQRRIKSYFLRHPELPIPRFFIQGSFKMGTMVIGKDGEYDVDVGVYFLVKPRVTAGTIKTNVYSALEVHTEYGTENRDKCIRVRYSGDFDIDLPVYYKTIADPHPFLATRFAWVPSDPKELCDWFKSKRDRNGQLQRLIKYVKYWTNLRPGKMPSGIAITVWMANNYRPNERDDVALYETLKAMKQSFWWQISCRNPATPGDNLVQKLSDVQKGNFLVYLNKLVSDAERAINERDEIRTISIWKKHFGDRFK